MTAMERATAARWCAWLVFAAIVGLTVTAAVLAAVNGPAGAWLNGWWVTAPSAVALSLPAVLLATRRPRQPVAWLLLGGALAFAVDAFPTLTAREREVLTLVAQGMSNSTIASHLCLSHKTVRNHVSNMFAKLQVADRAEAIIRTRRVGFGVAPDEIG
jgi:DNA-binding CsgD family transcriptional regulator